ncbi:EamA family transporter [Chitinibacter bivalviorum]|uniref:EamA family transporter n=1 Tax=Chitinibacter bivalviorum TaxID=2739434 RepID=A0A7H9BLJ7_9NEIS|nr:EamA family transporter [Chitinibacter bivalviorum]QLG89560.1 EamA family transporter [Chitinibacter bivalviorum]
MKNLTKGDLWLAQLMLLAVAMVWGSSYGVSKSALLFYPVLGFLALRFLITFALLLPRFLRYSRPEQANSIRTGTPLGLLIAAIFVCETYGVTQTSASNAAFLISLCLPLTPLAQWLLLGQKPEPRTWYWLALALLGAALLSGFAAQKAQLNRGDVLIFGAAILRAVVVTLTRKLTLAHPAPALGLSTIQTGIVGMSMLAIALVAIPIHQLQLPNAPDFWVKLIYLIMFCTLFAFFAQNWAASRLAPTRVAILLGLEPLFGALYGVGILGEQMSSSALIGAGLMLVAVLGLTGVWEGLCGSVLQMRQYAVRGVAARREASRQ